MGYYGDEKRRQMIRSILPCKAPSYKGIKRDLNARRRNNRRVNNQLLNRYSGGTVDETIEMYDEFGEDFEFYDEMHQGWGTWEDLVQNRRDRDKLNHFEHWAEQITAHLDPWDRMDYMRKIMPTGMIGAHAMSHLENAIGYDPIWEDRFKRPYKWEIRVAEEKRQKKEFVRAVAEALRSVAHSDTKRAALNKYMASNCTPVLLRFKAREGDEGAKHTSIQQLLKSRTETGRWNFQWTYWYTEDDCWNVRTMRGYHDCERMFRDLFRKHNERCISQAHHTHTNWLQSVVDYFKIEVPECIKDLTYFGVNYKDLGKWYK